MGSIIVPTREIDLFWSMISRIMNFEEELISRDNWGTRSDWCSYLHWKSPKTKEVLYFVDFLITSGILIQEGFITRQNIHIEKYILSDNYDDIIKNELEQTTLFHILEKWYEIYRK